MTSALLDNFIKLLSFLSKDFQDFISRTCKVDFLFIFFIFFEVPKIRNELVIKSVVNRVLLYLQFEKK